MNVHDGAVSLELDAATAHLLVQLAELWGVTEEEAIRRAIEQANADCDSSERYSEQEIFLFDVLFAANMTEIEGEVSEAARLAGVDWEALRRKVLYRLSKIREKASAADRMDAFSELKRRLNLTEGEAAHWQDAVQDARR
jgi:hypothetical protein